MRGSLSSSPAAPLANEPKCRSKHGPHLPKQFSPLRGRKTASQTTQFNSGHNVSKMLPPVPQGGGGISCSKGTSMQTTPCDPYGFGEGDRIRGAFGREYPSSKVKRPGSKREPEADRELSTFCTFSSALCTCCTDPATLLGTTSQGKAAGAQMLARIRGPERGSIGKRVDKVTCRKKWPRRANFDSRVGMQTLSQI